MSHRVRCMSLGLLILTGGVTVASGQQLKSSERLYHRNCASCHMSEAFKFARPLRKNSVRRPEEARSVIMEGIPGEMPGFKYMLSRAEVTMIIQYLAQLETPAAVIAIDRVEP